MHNFKENESKIEGKKAYGKANIKLRSGNIHSILNIETVFIVIILFSMLFTSCAIFKNTQFETNRQELPALIPYRVGDKWGYCDRNKNIVIQPIYTDAHLFSEGLACVNLNGKFGYIDNSGKTVIEPVYDNAGDFHDGFAWVEVYIKEKKEYKYGYINKEGKIVVSPVYDQAFDFNGNFAVVRVGYKYGAIDANGKRVVQITYDQLFVVEGNEGLFSGILSEKYGLLNAKENTILPFNYNWIGEFIDGLSLVSTLEGKCGFINTEGEFVIPLKYDGATDFHEGVAAVCVGDKWGFINEKNETVIQATYEEVGWFNEGLAPVKLNGYWGIINTKGEIIIQPTYNYIYSFGDNLAFVELNDKRGFIDSKGKMILTIPDSFDKLEYTTDYYFHDGLLAVYSQPMSTVSILVGYMDKNVTQYWKDKQ